MLNVIDQKVVEETLKTFPDLRIPRITTKEEAVQFRIEKARTAGEKVTSEMEAYIRQSEEKNMPQDHERRGSVYSKSSPLLAWDGLNFPGFSYDIDSNSFSEKLEIINISGRKISRGHLRYITGVKSPLEVGGINGSEKHG